MRIRYLAAAAVLVSALAVSGPVLAATTNGFQNGSFQCPTCDPSSSYVELGSDSTAITEWTVSAGNVDWIGTHWAPAVAGTYSIDLNGNQLGAIQQTFATTAGATYNASFYLSGNPDNGPGPKVLSVMASGNSIDTYTFPVSSTASDTNMTWLTPTYSFTATSGSTTLTFAGDPNAGAYGPVIDNVVVTPSAPPESVSVTCTDNCPVQVQSSTTGTSGAVAASSSSSVPFHLSAAFGTGTLSCDRFVTGHRTADPLAVTTTASSGQTVGGSVTLTFPNSNVNENRRDRDGRFAPVCVGATQRFPTWLPVPGSSSYPYQGLLFTCGNPIYKFLVAFGHYPLRICVSSYGWVQGAEQVVIQSSSFSGDPMYW